MSRTRMVKVVLIKKLK